MTGLSDISTAETTMNANLANTGNGKLKREAIQVVIKRSFLETIQMQSSDFLNPGVKFQPKNL